MKDIFLDKVKILLAFLEKEEILDSLVRIFNYPDEPQIFRYSTTLKNIKEFSDGNNVETSASGFSFESRSLALLKCLVEAAERFATLCYREKDLVFSEYTNLNTSGIDPCLFVNNKKLRTRRLGWTTGYDLFTGKPILIPAQTVFYSYNILDKEPSLTTQVSTGAAGGFDHELTLLRGLYEIIERDSFMGIYLAKIRVSKLNIENFDNKFVKKILEKAKRYSLEVMLFDITTDLGIPSYLGMVIDRTGLGPSISVGLKSSLSAESAIVGCLEESFLTRPWMRNEMLMKDIGQLPINPKSLTTIKDRGLFWISTAMLKHLKFLFDQPLKQVQVNKFSKNPNEELSLLVERLRERNMKTYYVNITPKILKKTGVIIYKTLIPQLQPLFFREKTPEIRHKRITQITHYFNKQKYHLNKVPHPFL